jgi:hypothetical protein
MSDSFNRCSRDAFRDLVPWADPYIAALMDKLRRESSARAGAVGELPPPLDSENAERDSTWQADWSPRNWPRG